MSVPEVRRKPTATCVYPRGGGLSPLPLPFGSAHTNALCFSGQLFVDLFLNVCFHKNLVHDFIDLCKQKLDTLNFMNFNLCLENTFYFVVGTLKKSFIETAILAHKNFLKLKGKKQNMYAKIVQIVLIGTFCIHKRYQFIYTYLYYWCYGNDSLILTAVDMSFVRGSVTMILDVCLYLR